MLTIYFFLIIKSKLLNNTNNSIIIGISVFFIVATLAILRFSFVMLLISLVFELGFEVGLGLELGVGLGSGVGSGGIILSLTVVLLVALLAKYVPFPRYLASTIGFPTLLKYDLLLQFHIRLLMQNQFFYHPHKSQQLLQEEYFHLHLLIYFQ